MPTKGYPVHCSSKRPDNKRFGKSRHSLEQNMTINQHGNKNPPGTLLATIADATPTLSIIIPRSALFEETRDATA